MRVHWAFAFETLHQLDTTFFGLVIGIFGETLWRHAESLADSEATLILSTHAT